MSAVLGLPANLPAFPADLLAFPADLLAFPADLLAFPADLRAFPADLLAFPAHLRPFPTHLLAFPADLRGLPADLWISRQGCVISGGFVDFAQRGIYLVVGLWAVVNIGRGGERLSARQVGGVRNTDVTPSRRSVVRAKGSWPKSCSWSAW